MPPYGTLPLLSELGISIAYASKTLFPILTGQAPSFEVALNWLQFNFTYNRTGAYIGPTLETLIRTIMTEGGAPFTPDLAILRDQFPGTYRPAYGYITSLTLPPGTHNIGDGVGGGYVEETHA